MKPRAELASTRDCISAGSRPDVSTTAGEVLLTAHTAALAPDLEGVVYESRGRQTLRNVRDPVELVAAVRQGNTRKDGQVVDPVCRMVVDPDRAAGRLTYDDRAYYFCTLACAGVFAREPERFTS